MVRDTLIKTRQTLFETINKATRHLTREADLVVASVLRPIRAKFFSQGWGPADRVEQMCDMALRKQLHPNVQTDERLDITWNMTASAAASNESVQVLEGRFRSPVAHLLGEESSMAHFQLVIPRRSLVDPKRHEFKPAGGAPLQVDSLFSRMVAAELGPLLQGPASRHVEEQGRIQRALEQAQAMAHQIPICGIFPATGEHGFTRRRQYIAEPLAREYGIGSLILINPFYYSRKPKKQNNSSLLHAIDLLCGGCGLIHEYAILHRYLMQHPTASFGPFGISGISMGGINTLLASSVLQFPVAAVPVTAPPSAAPVFEEGALSDLVDWKALQSDPLSIEPFVPDPRAGGRKGIITPGASRTTRQLLFDLFDMTDLRHYPAPLAPWAMIQIAAPHDRYAPRAGTLLKELWPHSELRWLPHSGHVSSYLFGTSKNKEAIRDAFVRLLAGPTQSRGRCVVISDEPDDSFDYHGKYVADIRDIASAIDQLGIQIPLTFSSKPPIL